MVEVDRAVKARESFAAELFERLHAGSHDGVGITRASYGEGEQFAHGLLAERARALDLEVALDAAGNTFMTLPGVEREAAPMIVGSHLDSVAQGGNFDGAAGVVAGLVAALALRDAGVVPPRDIRVMGIRAEEGEWFGESYIGARCALGMLPDGALDGATRSDTGINLHTHMLEAGCDPDAIRRGQMSLPPTEQYGFIEVHIEQGPVLDEAAIPVGVVTGIRGNSRLPGARCIGEYSHCGGVPRSHRRDAVMAVAELALQLDEIWTECEVRGQDFAFTVGKFFTDASFHAMSKIAGAVDFTIDMRSVDSEFLDAMDTRVTQLADTIGARRGVTFELGSFTRAQCGVLTRPMGDQLRNGIEALGINALDMASGASHDAAAFASAGVPTAMLFIRNANGSHNPLESMALGDFTEATRVLAWWLAHHL
jgi:beta-ureidopropionase / N-carbamoyl-L-amino-acid hydrolase